MLTTELINVQLDRLTNFTTIVTNRIVELSNIIAKQQEEIKAQTNAVLSCDFMLKQYEARFKKIEEKLLDIKKGD